MSLHKIKRMFKWESNPRLRPTFHFQKTLPTLSHLRFESVSCNSCPNLHEEDDAEQDGEGESHAVVLLDRTAASKECNKENNASYTLFIIIHFNKLFCIVFINCHLLLSENIFCIIRYTRCPRKNVHLYDRIINIIVRLPYHLRTFFWDTLYN